MGSEMCIRDRNCGVQYKTNDIDVVSKDYIDGTPEGFIDVSSGYEYTMEVNGTRPLTMAEEHFVASAIVEAYNRVNNPDERMMVEMHVLEETRNRVDDVLLSATSTSTDADAGTAVSDNLEDGDDADGSSLGVIYIDP